MKISITNSFGSYQRSVEMEFDSASYADWAAVTQIYERETAEDSGTEHGDDKP